MFKVNIMNILVLKSGVDPLSYIFICKTKKLFKWLKKEKE